MLHKNYDLKGSVAKQKKNDLGNLVPRIKAENV
jgi:hypothetical protein